MKKIIGFRVFTMEENFVKWQIDEDRVIFSVSPFVSDLRGDITEEENESKADFKMKPTVGVFVTYEYSIDQ